MNIFEKPPLTVYRIEHPEDGLGLWRSSGAKIGRKENFKISEHSKIKKIKRRHSNSLLFPSLYFDDELLRQLGDISCEPYNFAFLNKEQVNFALRRSEIEETVNKLGFRIYELIVTNYLKSYFQVIFKKENVIKKVDITGLFVKEN